MVPNKSVQGRLNKNPYNFQMWRLKPVYFIQIGSYNVIQREKNSENIFSKLSKVFLNVIN